MNESAIKTRALLYSLGVTECYKGFYYIISAMDLCFVQPQRLLLITKLIYPDVAHRYGVSWSSVERDIRTVGQVIWRRGRTRLEELAGAALSHRPCNAHLLSILFRNL